MKRILILANNDGGLFHFRKELLERFVRDNYDVIISAPEGTYKSQIEAIGCTYVSTNMDRHGMNPFKDGLLFLKYGKIIKKYKPDVILTYTIKPNIYGALQARLKKVPYLVNITGLGMALQNDWFMQKMLLAMYRVSMKKAACVFFQNEQNLQFMKEHGCVNSQTRLIPGSGVNIEEYAQIPYPDNEAPRILNITRIMKDKGIEEFMAAAERIKAAYPDIIFEVLGDYEEDTRVIYEPRIEELQKKGIIKYYGYQIDVKPYIERCDLVVNPTYHEGMSNVLLEAAASGRPVLASNISGCREIFEDGKGGIAFEPQSVEALTQALEKFLCMSYEERQTMGKEARKYIEKFFDRQIVIQAYLEEINTIEKRIKG